MKKQKDHKIWIKLLILLVLSFGMIFIIYKKTDSKNLKQEFLSMNKIYILYAMIFFILYRLMEAISLHKLLRDMGESVKFRHCANYAILGYFFSQITPTSGGGQPAQLYFMLRDGIKADKALSALVPFNIMFHVALLFVGVVSLFGELRSLVFNGRLLPLYILGILEQFVMIGFPLLAFKKSELLSRGINFILSKIKNVKFLNRFYKEPEYIREHVEGIKKNVGAVVKNKRTFATIFVFQVLMLFFYYSVAYFTYRAMGFSDYGLISIVMFQCLLIFSTEYIPTPGNAGVAEITMFGIYQKLVPKEKAVTWMMANRLLMLYIAIAITLIILYRRSLVRS